MTQSISVDEFIHDLARPLTNALLLTDSLHQEYGNSIPLSMKKDIDILTHELLKMTKILKESIIQK